MHKQVVGWAENGSPQEDVLYYFIRQVIEDGLISFCKINTAWNTADDLTKCLSKAQHQPVWIGSNSLNSHSIKTWYFYSKTYCYYFVGLQQPPVSPPSPQFSLHFSHFLSPVTPVPNPPLHTGGTKINPLASFHLMWLYCKCTKILHHNYDDICAPCISQ